MGLVTNGLWGSGQFSILLDTGLCVDQHRRMRLGGHTTTFYALHTGNIEEEEVSN